MPLLKAPADHGDTLSWDGMQYAIFRDIVDVPEEAVSDLLAHGFRMATEEETGEAGITASEDPAAAAEPDPGAPDLGRFEDAEDAEDAEGDGELPGILNLPPGERPGGWSGAKDPEAGPVDGDLTNAGQGPAPAPEPGIPPPQPATPPAHQGSATVVPNIHDMPRGEMIEYLARRGETIRADMRDSTLRERVQAARDKDHADLQRDLDRIAQAGPPLDRPEPEAGP